MIEIKPIEVSLPWQDVYNLIGGIEGWKERYRLGLKHKTRVNGGAIWRGADYEIILVGGNETSLIGLQTDNDKPAGIEAQKTWAMLDVFFRPYHLDKSSRGNAVRPKEPELGSSIDAYFDWYHVMKNNQFEITLKEIAIMVNRNPDYIRYLHSLYVKKKGHSKT